MGLTAWKKTALCWIVSCRLKGATTWAAYTNAVTLNIGQLSVMGIIC